MLAGIKKAEHPNPISFGEIYASGIHPFLQRLDEVIHSAAPNEQCSPDLQTHVFSERRGLVRSDLRIQHGRGKNDRFCWTVKSSTARDKESLLHQACTNW